MLYFIPTPIGSKDDITIKSLNYLKSLKYFICEDTRTLKKLMQLFDIEYKDKEFFTLTSFTNAGRLKHYINILKENDVGVTSEYGTPGLSDPGKIMIKLCNENGLLYSILPGANALVPAVVAAGFDTSEFVFMGFLPKKKGKQTMMKRIISSDKPVFIYESMHRIEKVLLEFKTLGFDGKVAIAREISKLNEQFVTDTIDNILEKFKSGDIKNFGEFVVGFCNIK